MSRQDWLVQVPLSELLAVQNIARDMDEMEMEISQLRREIDGLRRVQTDTLQLVGDLRQEVRKGRTQ